jgi:hypothetical protein
MKQRYSYLQAVALDDLVEELRFGRTSLQLLGSLHLLRLSVARIELYLPYVPVTWCTTNVREISLMEPKPMSIFL